MKQEKYEILKKILERIEAEGFITISPETGLIKKGNIELGSITADGYKLVGWTYEKKQYHFYVHQVIAVYCGLNPVDKHIDHLNNNKQDNRICNLEIVSQSENSQRAWDDGLRKRRRGQNPTKLTPEKVKIIKKMLAQGNLSHTTIAELFNVSKDTIYKISQGKTWRKVVI